MTVPTSSCHGGYPVRGSVAFAAGTGIHRWRLVITNGNGSAGVVPQVNAPDSKVGWTLSEADSARVAAQAAREGYGFGRALTTRHNGPATVDLELDTDTRRLRWTVDGNQGGADLAGQGPWCAVTDLSHGCSAELKPHGGAGAAAAAAGAPPTAVLHNFVRNRCMVCTACAVCTGFGRGCVHCGAKDRAGDRGKECGCGGGNSGCGACGMCEACARTRPGGCPGSTVAAMAQVQVQPFGAPAAAPAWGAAPAAAAPFGASAATAPFGAPAAAPAWGAAPAAAAAPFGAPAAAGSPFGAKPGLFGQPAPAAPAWGAAPAAVTPFGAPAAGALPVLPGSCAARRNPQKGDKTCEHCAGKYTVCI